MGIKVIIQMPNFTDPALIHAPAPIQSIAEFENIHGLLLI